MSNEIVPTTTGGPTTVIGGSPPVPLQPSASGQAHPPDIRPFVNFNPDGVIRHGGIQDIKYTREAIEEGAYVAEGDGGWNPQTQIFERYAVYDDAEKKWITAPRPNIEGDFDTYEMPVMIEAVFADMPRCGVEYEGPISGAFLHEGGVFHIGWTVPGVYRLTVTADPYMGRTFTFNVKAAR